MKVAGIEMHGWDAVVVFIVTLGMAIGIRWLMDKFFNRKAHWLLVI